MAFKVNSLLFKINAATVLTVFFVALGGIVLQYPIEQSRFKGQTSRIELLLATLYKEKRNDLANELFAGQTRALQSSLVTTHPYLFQPQVSYQTKPAELLPTD